MNLSTEETLLVLDAVKRDRRRRTKEIEAVKNWNREGYQMMMHMDNYKHKLNNLQSELVKLCDAENRLHIHYCQTRLPDLGLTKRA